MTRHTCDRCGKGLNDRIPFMLADGRRVGEIHVGEQKRDLCEDCGNAVIREIDEHLRHQGARGQR